jgi:hypothetical protein
MIIVLQNLARLVTPVLHGEVILNFSSRILLVTILLVSLGPKVAQAIEVNAYYSSSCERQIGLPIKVENHNIYVLNLEGEIKKIPRYDIIAVAKYPLDQLPIAKLATDSKVIKKHYRVKTFFKRQIVPLVEGWPINFSSDQISFLTLQGKEIAISRKSIWDIKKVETKKELTFSGASKKNFKFIHPANLKGCNGHDKNKKTIAIYPQEYITDSITIKRRLDYLSEQEKEVEGYIREKNFYAVPQVYTNQSTLGFWMQMGSRHGKSRSRSNNGAPILETQFSDGPFGFQSMSLTGSSPNKYMIHEEAQTQFFYRFKVDYFHMGFMFDPNLILVGSKYKWQADDLDHNDFRQNESSLLELGLDVGNFSFIAIIHSKSRWGFKDGNNNFFYTSANFNRLGLSFQNHLFELQLFYWAKDWASDDGFGVVDTSYDQIKYDSTFFRANLDYDIDKDLSFLYSMIYKKVDSTHQGTSLINAKSLTNVIYGRYNINYKYQVGAMVSLEKQEVEQVSNNHLKAGAKLSIRF